MLANHRRWAAGLGLGLVAAALAPAAPQPPQQQPPPQQIPQELRPSAAPTEDLARLRAGAAAATWDQAWLYFSENRIDADTVYRWSRRRREADLDAARDPAARVAASEAHRVRMLDLEAKITKIRRLGFGTSFEVVAAEYYRKEAEFWLAEARTR